MGTKGLKRDLTLVGIGAVLGVVVAETWRRKLCGDSYLDLLPPIEDRAASPVEGEGSKGRIRGAADRLWSPVSASAQRDLAHLRRIRAGAPPP